MMDIGTPCRETISFIYNLLRVSILSVSLVGMKCADLVRRSTMTQITVEDVEEWVVWMKPEAFYAQSMVFEDRIVGVGLEEDPSSLWEAIENTIERKNGSPTLLHLHLSAGFFFLRRQESLVDASFLLGT
ncbi:hypothetical protein Tco_0122487 [Tanacetum coccineum]